MLAFFTYIFAHVRRERLGEDDNHRRHAREREEVIRWRACYVRRVEAARQSEAGYVWDSDMLRQMSSPVLAS